MSTTTPINETSAAQPWRPVREGYTTTRAEQVSAGRFTVSIRPIWTDTDGVTIAIRTETDEPLAAQDVETFLVQFATAVRRAAGTAPPA